MVRHRLLRRQLKKLQLTLETLPDSEAWRDILESVDRAYTQADQDRYLLERSLAISSREMQELYDDLKQASETQIASERDRLQMVMDHVADGIITFDRAGKILTYNHAATRIFGYSQEDALGLNFMALVVDPPQGFEKENWISALCGEGVVLEDCELTGLREDGQQFPMALSVSEAQQDGAQVFIAVLRDVTRRVQAEVALRESEEKYRILIENASEAVVVIVDGRIEFVNQKAFEISGFTREELLGSSYMRLVHPEDRDLVSHRSDLRRQGESPPVAYAFRILRKDQTVRWIRINVVLITWDGQPATLNFIGDITEHKRAERAILEERDRAQTYLDLAGTILVAIDKDQTINLINRKGCEVLGYPEEEIVGVNWFDNFVPERHREALRASFLQMVAGEIDDFEYFENTIFTKDGQERLVAWHNTLLCDEDGNVVSTLSSGEDITERSRFESDLRRHAEDLALINAMNEAVNRGASFEEGIKILVDGTKRIFACRGAIVHLLEPDNNVLVTQNLSYPGPVMKGLEKIIGEKVPRLEIPVENVSRYSQLLENQQAILSNDRDEIYNHMQEIAQVANLPNENLRKTALRFIPQIAKLLDIQSNMTVPLVTNGAVTGFLEISRGKPFDEADLERFVSIASPFSAILERKRADDALRESEERYRLLFENAPIGLGIADEDANLLDFNSAMLVPSQYTREEIREIGKVSEMYADTATRDAVLARANEQGYLHREEVQFRRKDGSTYDALLSLSPIQTNGKKLWQAMVEDITERKAYERRLLLQAKVLEAAANAIVITNRDGKITWTNPAFTDLTGYTSEEVLGQNLRLLKSGTQDAAFYRNLWETILDGEVWEGELVNRKKTGDQYYEHQTITPLRSQDGEISHYIAVKQDITARVQTEEQMRRRNRELVLLNRVIAAASSTLDTPAILEVVCRELAEAFDIPQAAATLLQEDGKLKVVAEHLTEGLLSALNMIIPIEGNPATSYVIQNKAALVIDDVQADPRMAPIKDIMAQRNTHSLMILPLVVRGEVVGTIGLDSLSLREFTKEEVSLAMAVASTVAQTIDTARLFAETRRRTAQLESLTEVSSAMREAATRAEMYPIILNQLLFLLQADGAKLALRDPSTGGMVVKLARGAWANLTGNQTAAGEGVTGQVVAQSEPYINNNLEAEPVEDPIASLAGLQAVACFPLIAQEQAIGALCVGRQDSFSHEELNLLSAICDMAANAIHRASLFEQTGRRLRRLVALRMIDEAITASVDLRLTLNILLEQVGSQLNVDAATILLLSEHTKILEPAARRGFNTGALRQTRVRLGEGYAGRAALERKIVHVPNLVETSERAEYAVVLAREGFVDYYAVPLIAKGQVKGVLEIYNRSFFPTDPEWRDFLETLAGRAAIAIDNISLFDGLQRSNVELTLAYDATIEGWARALELRDRETKGHSQRVTDLTLRLARIMGMTEVELEHTRRGALLHDIGKMGVPDQILNKPGPLTDEEWEIMRQHPVYAYDMLAPIAYLRPALDIPYCHHEKWNGTGYPRGLSEAQIPLSARIFAVVDVWDALCSDRPYRPAWPEQKALDYIQEEAGSHFDPRVVDEFLKIIK